MKRLAFGVAPLPSDGSASTSCVSTDRTNVPRAQQIMSSSYLWKAIPLTSFPMQKAAGQ